jgi:hypothetical protein
MAAPLGDSTGAYEESRRAGSHAEAQRHAPDTELPIREGARHILRAMRPKERRR